MPRHYLELLSQYAKFEPQLLADPYFLYEQLRSENPVCWSEALDCWVITRYHEVLSALRDPRFSSNRMRAFMNQLPDSNRDETLWLRRYLSMFMGLSDPPTHTRLRGLVNQAFTPPAIEGMRLQIQQTVDSLIDKVELTGKMDVVRDLANPLPIVIISEILGLPAENRDQFKKWSDDIVGFLGTGRAIVDRAQCAYQSMRELANYYLGIIAERGNKPRKDLISSLIAAEDQGDKLTEEELLATCVTLLAGGHETTTNLIGNSLLALMRNPKQLVKLKNDPSLIVTAIEELLRYESPVSRAERVAAEDCEIEGRHISKGQRIFLMLGSANRDSLQFPDPDVLEITRQPNRHLAFGYGIHFCVGAPLARLEGKIAINTILRRLPNLQLASESLEWHENLAIRGLKSLPVVF